MKRENFTGSKFDPELVVKLGQRVLELLKVEPDNPDGTIELQLLRDGSLRILTQASRGRSSCRLES